MTLFSANVTYVRLSLWILLGSFVVGRLQCLYLGYTVQCPVLLHYHHFIMIIVVIFRFSTCESSSDFHSIRLCPHNHSSIMVIILQLYYSTVTRKMCINNCFLVSFSRANIFMPVPDLPDSRIYYYYLYYCIKWRVLPNCLDLVVNGLKTRGVILAILCCWSHLGKLFSGRVNVTCCCLIIY